MAVISTEKDLEALSLTIVAEFDAAVERVWQIWEDPRQLERWWGPPTYPATFDKHEFREGGSSSYYMTGPEGDKSGGWWKFTAIDSPRRLEFDDGFADESGAPMDELGETHAVVTLEEVEAGRTRMTVASSFESADQLQQMIEMGMEEGLKEAMGQIDGILAERARV
ncbi:SRPBCC domain-containing protein [uncultured Arthrobacter sp.]|uniref:SRPBCC family protein n=1 Tax=uncultured Arthrobacter sp. TaxID=114050 RepID=UPI00263489A8|nr:SRPBCC domain-containing protein [uncultured Arthrobacter sp.]